MRICDRLIMRSLALFGETARLSAVIEDSGLSKADAMPRIRNLIGRKLIEIGKGKNPFLQTSYLGRITYEASAPIPESINTK